MKLVFATNNKHKLREVQELLPEGIEVLTLRDIGCKEEIEETAETLECNAKIKSDHVKNTYGYDCFADDTGLEVSALNGAPGVYSARYAGENVTFEDNVNKMLNELQGVTNREARFRTVVSLIWKGKQYFFEGICNGRIEEKKSGDQGFGYDPIFFIPEDGCTMAQLSDQRKNEISHRGRAANAAIPRLKDLFA